MKAEKKSWQPPEFISREQCIRDTEEVLGMPDIPIRQTEDIFRINVLGMDWDIGMVVHEPEDSSKIPMAPTAKKPASSCFMAAPVISKASSGMPSCSPASSASKLSPALFPEDSTSPMPAAIGPTIPSMPTAPCARRSGNKASDHPGPIRRCERSFHAQPLRYAHPCARKAG